MTKPKFIVRAMESWDEVAVTTNQKDAVKIAKWFNGNDSINGGEIAEIVLIYR